MAMIDDYMDGFYNEDYNNKSNPKGFQEMRVYAYEMKIELQKLINSKHVVKTGYRGQPGTADRKYLIFYKK